MLQTIEWFDSLRRTDVTRVGGKNASLGEMVHALAPRGIRMPPGFATTANAYWQFVDGNGLREEIGALVADWKARRIALSEAGTAIRDLILQGDWPGELETSILASYRELKRRMGLAELAVAVRSSATAEDLPDASFAGQQESFLNITGESELMLACKRCYASLFTDRAISYREAKGFDHLKVALSIGVQVMVRSDLGGAGVMFSIDTETGFDKIVLINAAWGLGENVVQGAVDPDEYQVFKPLLHRTGVTPIIEKKMGAKAIKMIYSRGEMFIVQARPETVQSRRSAASLRSYEITQKGATLASGIAIGDAVVAGQVCLIDSAKDLDQFIEGSILVTSTTDPDWVPIMKRAKAIITDHGGRTSHAAIVSRELGLPAIVGTGVATDLLHGGQEVTVSCAEGDEGYIYEGTAKVRETDVDVSTVPTTRIQVMLNLGNPAAAFRWWRLPSDGVGLARMEFVVANTIRVHPMALIEFDRVKDEGVRREIATITAGYADKTEYFVDQLSRGLARIAASVYPKPVIVRLSDFKTNEYASLVGGAQFEPDEENPMIGLRGASRYYSGAYGPAFALECRAIDRLRKQIGLDNVVVMVPFCRSTTEARKVLEVMAGHGLVRGDVGLLIYVMCEIPSNVILAKRFAEHFDGFSIGSNDLTQLTLGVDRDSGELKDLFDEQDEAVKWMIAHAISEAKEVGAKIGLCGQAPSDHPQFARFLVECGIDSISVSPDSFVSVKHHVAAAEAGEDGSGA